MEIRSRGRQQNKGGDALKAERALRCHCGSLLARLVAEGVQIKCRRCKRQVILPIEKRVREFVHVTEGLFDGLWRPKI